METRSARTFLLLLTGVLAAGLIAVGWRAVATRNDNRPAAIVVGTPNLLAPQPKTRAPTIEADKVHRAVHALAKICDTGDTTDKTPLVRPQIETILDFARRFPNVKFQIDDEIGTTVSLLIVARDGVRTCAPGLVAEINSALPKQFQLPDTSG